MLIKQRKPFDICFQLFKLTHFKIAIYLPFKRNWSCRNLNIPMHVIISYFFPYEKYLLDCINRQKSL